MTRFRNIDVSLVRQRLAVLERLEQSLAESETAILAMDAAKLGRFADEQQDLCVEWQALDRRIANAAQPSSEAPTASLPIAGGSDPALAHWHLVLDESRRIELALRQRTRLHAALLRRMRRSMRWLGALVDTPARTYSVGEEMQVVGRSTPGRE